MSLDILAVREFAARYTAAWCSQDAARVASFFSLSGSLAINGGAPAVGREEIAKAAQGFMSAFPDLLVAMDDLLPCQDGAVYHWTLTGTNAGPGGSGKPVQISGFEVWKLDADGLIAESQGRFDAEEYRRQLL